MASFTSGRPESTNIRANKYFPINSGGGKGTTAASYTEYDI